jgi:hypothetical protein
MACKENHLTDWKITKRTPINKDNSKKISDSFDNYFQKGSIKLFLLINKTVIVNYRNQSFFRKVDECLTKIVENLYESEVFFESISWQSAKTNDKINKEIKDIAGNITILFEKILLN